MAGSITGVIEPYMFEPDTYSQGKEEELFVQDRTPACMRPPQNRESN